MSLFKVTCNHAPLHQLKETSIAMLHVTVQTILESRTIHLTTSVGDFNVGKELENKI